MIKQASKSFEVQSLVPFSILAANAPLPVSIFHFSLLREPLDPWQMTKQKWDMENEITAKFSPDYLPSDGIDRGCAAPGRR